MKKAEAEVEKVKITALTAETLWKEKVKALDSDAQGLDARERKVAERERQVSMGVEPESPKKKKSE